MTFKYLSYYFDRRNWLVRRYNWYIPVLVAHMGKPGESGVFKIPYLNPICPKPQKTEYPF